MGDPTADAPHPQPETDRTARPPADLTDSAMRLVRGSLSHSRAAAVRLTLWTLLHAAPALVAGKTLALAVDHGFLLHRPRTAALWLGVFALVTLAGAWASRQTYPSLAEIVEPQRDRLLRDVVTGTLRRAVARGPRRRDDSAAVAVAQLTRQVEAVRDSLAGQLMLVWQFVLTVAAVVAGTAAIAPGAVPLVAAPLVLALTVFAVLAPATVRRQRTAFVAEEVLAHRTVSTLHALRDLVACGAAEKAEREMLDAIDAHLRASRALARLAAVRRMIVALGAHAPLLLIVLAAPTLVRHGMTSGDVVGVVAYVLATLEPAVRLLIQGVGASWLRLAVAAERLSAASRHPAPGTDPQPARTPVDGSAELSDLTFAYGPDAQPVLDGLDLSLADGDHLAVVGPSGIGKSTMADVLAGILAPDRGQVLLGGVPLEHIARGDLHRARVLLPQDPYVFAGSVRENLCYLAPDTPDDAVAAAVEQLGMARTVQRLGGLDAILTPAELSSGEAELIALARAYLSPARLVILDEATRHLDAVAEHRVEQAFRRRPGTVVTIAHRIAPARRADRVLLLDGVRPLTGTHDALLASAPLYADLVGHWDTGVPGTDEACPGNTGRAVSAPASASDRSSSCPSADPAP
ncbi:ABC transporter ATP-binding protein [Streptomyces sp. HUAS 14-6]|uniref:ABC transporter ATP-binding protein/permease n=1 Tax=Streptomyces albidocamelliae TaxID=2981135 RepID=A0ABY6EFE7_9ACTN|nr:ABC transporter ATP-binding protein [Streptomyces sp. HUAS 14-6]UXY33550.1 ABC transporter ATP-binding protein/permease [Streptomyces sp. HUAS 14-6]